MKNFLAPKIAAYIIWPLAPLNYRWASRALSLLLGVKCEVEEIVDPEDDADFDREIKRLRAVWGIPEPRNGE